MEQNIFVKKGAESTDESIKRDPEIIKEALIGEIENAVEKADSVRCRNAVERLQKEYGEDLKTTVMELCSKGIDNALSLSKDTYQCYYEYEFLRYENAIRHAKDFAEVSGINFSEKQLQKLAEVASAGIDAALELALRYARHADVYNFGEMLNRIAFFQKNGGIELSKEQVEKIRFCGHTGVSSTIELELKKHISPHPGGGYDVVYPMNILAWTKEACEMAKLTGIEMSNRHKEFLATAAEASIDHIIVDLESLEAFDNDNMYQICQATDEIKEFVKLSGTLFSARQRYKVSRAYITELNSLAEEVSNSIIHDGKDFDRRISGILRFSRKLFSDVCGNHEERDAAKYRIKEQIIAPLVGYSKKYPEAQPKYQILFDALVSKDSGEA